MSVKYYSNSVYILVSGKLRNLELSVLLKGGFVWVSLSKV